MTEKKSTDGPPATRKKLMWSKLSRTELGRGLRVGLEVTGRQKAEGRVAPFGVVLSDVVADFEFGFGQAGEAAASEQFSFEAGPERFGVRITIAVAAPARALLRPVAYQ